MNENEDQTTAFAAGAASPPPCIGDGQELQQWVLREMMECLDRTQKNNVDASYPPFGITLDRAAYDIRRSQYVAFVGEHRDALYETYALLGDSESRELFLRLILFRALGHEHIRLPSNTEAFWQAHGKAAALPSRPSDLQQQVDAGALLHFEHHVGDAAPLRVDCLRANMLFTFLLRQYHLRRGDTSITPRLGDYILDVGACFGDTAIDMAHAAGPQGCVHSFELVDSHLAVLRHNAAQNPGLAPIVVHSFGLSDHTTHGATHSGPPDPGYRVDMNSEVPLRRLDDMVAEGLIERVDLIKMDIEGHEEAALRGAIETLRKFRPRLAISLYHRWEDYYRIPRLLHSLQLGYRFYLDNYTISDGETILYAQVAQSS